MSAHPNKWQFVRKLVDVLGLYPAVHYLTTHALRGLLPSRRPFRLYSRYAAHALWCRPGTSDIQVFGQIFIDREYRCLDDLTAADLILDCGANVGYSAAYFLTRFSAAKLIAVEPDPENFALLERNTANFGQRATCLRAAVWPHEGPLRLSEATAGAGREWARTVHAATAEDPQSVRGVTVPSLLRDSGCERISILKIDIEGAERELFAAGDYRWLARVDTIVIELHGPRCREAFMRAIASDNFAVTECDELTVCRRRTAQATAPSAAASALRTSASGRT